MDPQQEDKENSTTVQEPEKHLVPVKKKNLVKIKESIRKLPEKKPHLDFIAAILTIPLLALTLYLNISNLKNKTTTTPTPSPSPVSQQTSNQVPAAPRSEQIQNITPQVVTTTPQPTPDTNTCIKDIGPIAISYPSEGQTTTDNPLCIQIDYQAGNYCSVVWSYKINNSSWSDYSNNSVCLYNLPSGNNTFQLQVKSLASPSTQTLTRHFINGATVSPTTTPTITPTVQVTPTVTPS